MIIFVGSDHAGFGLKESLIVFLQGMGYEVEDKGAHEYTETDDFPDFVIPVAREVSMHPNEVKGIILGGSGQGEAMCANRFKHVRATVFYGNAASVAGTDVSIIKLGREHNNSNILSLGARFITEEQMKEGVREWLEAPFSEAERHVRRITKMDNIHE